MSSIFLLSLKKTQTMGFPKIHLLLFTIFTFLSLPKFLSQLVPPLPVLVPAPAPAPAADICNGVFLSYIYISGKRLPPLNSTNQAYKFKSIATILNNGVDEFKGWRLFVGFQHDEILVSATSVVLADGTNLPAPVGNGTVFAGFPSSDLQTAIDTAGDLTQMELQIKLVGTQFGVKPPSIPMPSNISLLNDGYICPQPTMQGKNVMQVCCVKDPDFTATTTEVEFLPRQNGDLTIDYDVIKTFDANYFAEVKMSMHNSLGRLDHWKLTWDWMRDEFILGMKGAYPSIVDSTDCIYGPQGAHYTNLDFSTVLNCQKRPTIIDLPATVANDPNLGMIPFCCRNGTILPEEMNPSWSSSAFQIQVQKMPPDLNRTELFPPQNWKISGSSLNPNYKCGPPIRVSASQYPSPNGLLSVNTTAVASWQVVCNITQPTGASPKCCVSFSAFYNDSVIPCETCACGCPKNPSQTCSATSQAMILPPDALLVPFVNRTAKAVAWASLKHRPIPSPLPCPDNCGVSINWHLNSDFTKGWTARVTLFNWAETVYPDWFTAMEFKKAVPGFEAMYSFNGTILNTTANNTIFMTGLPGLNYLMPILPANATLKNPPIPGKQQSVISFTKKLTPGIDIIGGDGFPTKVFFNGEECSLPSIIPMNNGHKFDSSFSGIWVFVISVITLRLIQQ